MPAPTTSAIRVASVPSGHPYVRHIDDPAVGGVVRLPDPPVAGAPAGQWWPPAMLEPRWVHAHADDFDVLHLHFGFDDRTPAQLHALVVALRAEGRPLVLTVHDLQNPHHSDPRQHRAALDVLVPAADAVVTLTPGAATEIRRRWGRVARVVPHPHVVPAELLGRRRPARDGFVVGVHAKSVRANTAPVAVARAVAGALTTLPGARLRVDVHDDRRGRAVADALPELDVRVHPRFSDDELWHYLTELDVSVLPYRSGTHSGWLEACHDLGTTVLAPTCGFYDEQGPCLRYRHDDAGLDATSLAAAVREAWTLRPAWQADPTGRAVQRRNVAEAHRDVYRSVLAPAAAP